MIISTKVVVGSLPCSTTKFLGPLMKEGLVELAGHIQTGNLIHPIQGVPPFELSIEADLKGLEAVCTLLVQLR
jgi:hypothetical protein